MSEPRTNGPGPSEDGGDEGVDARAERVIYRDDEEFRKALDAAAESIRKAEGPDVVGNIIWWGLLALLAFAYTAQWTIGWNVRHELLPGVDLVKPLWVVIIGVFGLHMLEIRRRHGTILRRRLCLKCGTSLLEVPVTDVGAGVCPTCERVFNLGEYRKPEHNRGRGFRGYIDGDHFDKVIYTAAEQIKAKGSLGFEADLMWWLWVALGVAFGFMAVLGWNLFAWVPRWFPLYGIWFVGLLIWGFIYVFRVKKLRPAIVDERLCMNCGFCLRGTPTDDDGVGRCPECAEEFVPEQYLHPEAHDGE